MPKKICKCNSCAKGVRRPYLDALGVPAHNHACVVCAVPGARCYGRPGECERIQRGFVHYCRSFPGERENGIYRHYDGLLAGTREEYMIPYREFQRDYPPF